MPWRKDNDGALTYSPFRLKFYEREHDEFQDAYARKLTRREAGMVYTKLLRHFKLGTKYIYFKSRLSSGGKANRRYIILGKSPNFGILCHEVAHLIDFRKRRSKHDKTLMFIMRRVVNYCKKRQWWEKELKKRTEPKVVIQPTEEQKKQAKILKRKADLERYHKRLNYFTKLYTNKIKKANRSIATLQRFAGVSGK